jgi:Zn-dependent protease/predicted transcriptional regulator
MKWSWKLGELAGIGVYLHWTFLILLGWILLAHLFSGSAVAVALEGVALIVAVFGCIVLHELGHALTARRYGIQTRDITLLPIGGVARLERMPEEPREELWVALAGPAVNVVIAAILLGISLALGRIERVTEVAPVGGDFVNKLLVINVFLVLFNLLPAFPMDGGRVLRALLAWKWGDTVWATNVAAAVGQFMAMLFGFLGLFGSNPLLIFIALFVFLGAQQEAYNAQLRSAFKGVPVSDAMMTRYRSLAPSDTLGRAVEELLAGSQQDFPVVEHSQLVGVLPRNEMVKALAERGREVHVGEVMVQDCRTAAETDGLQETFERMRGEQCSSLPVVRDGQLVGMVTMENVGELIMVRSALGDGLPQGASGNLFNLR